MRHILDITDLSVEEIDLLTDTAIDIINNGKSYENACRGQKLATLFYEPSTRTRLSFSAAMMELGGDVLGFSDAAASSVSKGETVADTIRVVENFANIVAMRHNLEGAPWVAAQYAKIPIINAGDGSHCHPTQTLTDLLTIKREKGRFDNLTVGICGDLKYGRTVHSLIAAMLRYKNINFVLIAPNELKLPEYIRNDIKKSNHKYSEHTSLENNMGKLDVLYMTRVQQERFDNKDEYNKLKDSFVLDKAKMLNAKNDMIVLHPLPRINEIAKEVDSDHRALYFEQVLNGKYIRMSLIYNLLNNSLSENNKDFLPGIAAESRCTNPKCISVVEQEPPMCKNMDGKKRCFYCDCNM